MDENAYWSSLEYRVCSELDGMPRKHRGALWCDGFCPEAYLLADEPPRIVGHCFIGYSPDIDEWRFELHLPAKVRSREEIDWASLLPPDNRTCWLAIDESRRRLQIEPAVAIPDLE